jgi:anti-sigma-K factor RskA
MDPHDLTAAYALDALDPDEVEAYERHLSQCEECRAQLAELNEGAAALAFGAVAPVPPPRLREAILDSAAAERSNVVPLLRRRWVARGLAVAAAAAACIVVGLAVALSQSNGKQAIQTSVVVVNGFGTLNVSGLSATANGKTYEAWVIPARRSPRPAGLFRGGGNTRVGLGRVPNGAVVAVTVEPAGGSKAPTTEPILSVRT